MGQRELERDEHGSRERRQLERALAPRHDRDDERRARPRGRRGPAGGTRGRGSRARGTDPSPRSRTASRGPTGSRSCAPRTCEAPPTATARAAGSRTRATRRDDERRCEAEDAAEVERPGTSPRAARRAARRTSSSPRARPTAPRARSDVTSQKPKTRNAGMIASFVFAFSVYAVNGYAAHANASSTRAGAAEAQADQEEREHREQVERDRGRVRRRQRVPLPAPREDRDRRHVREIRDRAVRVAPLDRRPRSGRSSGCARAPAPRRPSARTARGRRAAACSRTAPGRRGCGRADDAREADVDDPARCLDVQADPEPEKEDGRGREHPGRPDGRERGPTPAEADPETAREQVDENRVDERDAPEDLAAVVEGERDGEPEQHEEIEVRDRERASEIGEAEEEDEAERQPDDGLQERLPAEGALAPACHLPRDLRPGPHLRHPPSCPPARRVRSDRPHPTTP